MRSPKSLFFEWVVIDNCNLNCDYCVNRGEYSQKAADRMRYIPGVEIDIAGRLVEASRHVTRTTVNITGGEPLLARDIREVIGILGEAERLDIQLITNYLLAGKVADLLPGVSKVIISLHVRYRDANGIDALVDLVNATKGSTRIVLTQVDHDLRLEDRRVLGHISRKTGLPIAFQTYMPPWTKEGQVEDSQKIRDANFVPSLGKRCSLGYTYFFVNPDGTFYYDLWCREESRKTGNFLDPFEVNREAFFPPHMKRCPATSCGCNYNVFNHAEYTAECRRLGYAEEEIFGRRNITVAAWLKRKVSDIGNRYLPSRGRRHR
ncbi:MAG: 4Fe-4S cluster-binding domain-containing protein [bacterium]|nr:4Fe-4S cluster-binding domain-containing protein [bacterium]